MIIQIIYKETGSSLATEYSATNIIAVFIALLIYFLDYIIWK